MFNTFFGVFEGLAREADIRRTAKFKRLNELPDLHDNATWKAIEKAATTDTRYTHIVKGMLEIREWMEAIVEYLEDRK